MEIIKKKAVHGIAIHHVHGIIHIIIIAAAKMIRAIIHNVVRVPNADLIANIVPISVYNAEVVARNLYGLRSDTFSPHELIITSVEVITEESKEVMYLFHFEEITRYVRPCILRFYFMLFNPD